MKYPITPDYLESVPDPLIGLYTDLEEKILKDICRRFKMSGEATESAIAQMKILQERGVSLDDIEKFIRETLNLSEKELDKIIDRAVDRNRQYYDRLIEKADILNAEFRGLDREIAAIRRQTHDELFNLTQSMGFAIRTGREVEFLPVAKTYQKVLDDAAAQVLSGAVDYNTSIKEAVKRLTDSGLQTIDYASGWHNRVDVAVRRAVMTGVSQLSSQYAEHAAEELETDLREVTAHAGARDTGTGWQNHKSWQGKVYSVKAGDKYPNIYEVCGWCMVDGLEGANCRHHHYPFLEGVSERTYTDEQLENIDPPPFEYQGKTYTAYEATQKQRQIERAMRKSKREIIGYEASGQTEEAQDSAIRLRRLSQEYKAFSKAAGLRTENERLHVAGIGKTHGMKPVTNSLAKAYYAETDKIKWPPKGELISAESFREIRDYAQSKGIHLQGFKGSDVDKKLVLETVDAAEALLDKYPELLGSSKRPFTLYLDRNMASVDFAEVKDGVPHIMHLNADAYRQKASLQAEYKKLADDGWFVSGTDHSSVVYHEMGHMVSDVYGIDGMEVMKQVLKAQNDAEVIVWCKGNLSTYSAKVDGSEIIAEAFSAFYGLETPKKEIVDFVEICGSIIKLRRRG